MSSHSHLSILETTQIGPFSKSETNFSSLPLTFYDLLFLKFPPSEQLCFYEIPDLTSEQFNSEIVPRLKHAFSITLDDFLPLAGGFIWPSDDPKPSIRYTPGDTVSLTIGESTADFNGLCGDEIFDITDAYHLLPKLMVTEEKACILSLQITLFPNKGFCIGISTHHAVVDAKTAAMFLKSWAYLCKQEEESLLPKLLPSYDRTIIKDSAGLESAYMHRWNMVRELITKEPNPHSLKNLSNPFGINTPSNPVRATMKLTHEDIAKLRKRVVSTFTGDDVKELHLSTFVLASANMLVALVKARGEESDRKVYFPFVADCSTRVDPPVPSNYFGNCVRFCVVVEEAGVFMAENGLAVVAERISDKIKEIAVKGIFDGAENSEMAALRPEEQMIGIIGSTRSGFYELDCGWGRPKKVEISSVYKVAATYILESRDGKGNVEIGLALEPNQMNRFVELFYSGLRD